MRARILLLLAFALPACTQEAPPLATSSQAPPAATSPAATPADTAPAAAKETVPAGDPRAAVEAVVVAFGRALKNVPLAASDAVARAAIEKEYSRFVTPELLARWAASPAEAPGRRVSSPWPERIEVRRTSVDGAKATVEGDIVEVTSVEVARGGASARAPVRAGLVRDAAGWRIASFEEQRDTERPGNPEEPAVSEAATVVRAYYAAINRKDYAAAYKLWSGEGTASGKSLEQFRDGFRDTARSEVTVGTPGSVGAAAGSRYVEIPVTITATTTTGAKRRFAGTYVLRRAVVDGATAEQRAWRIGSASIHAVSP